MCPGGVLGGPKRLGAKVLVQSARPLQGQHICRAPQAPIRGPRRHAGGSAMAPRIDHGMGYELVRGPYSN
jgi:hypothetical protein